MFICAWSLDISEGEGRGAEVTRGGSALGVCTSETEPKESPFCSA